jgi:soluble lytic murein transglycosylase-like protein
LKTADDFFSLKNSARKKGSPAKMKRSRPDGTFVPCEYLFVFFSVMVAILFVGPRTAFHQPLSAALPTDQPTRSSVTTTHLWAANAQSPESKRFDKKPVHPAAFDRHFFAWQKAVRIHQIVRDTDGNSVEVNRTEKRYLKMILEIATHYGVDPLLIAAMVKAESSYNPRAVSPTGAAGLMQLMPDTADELGVADSFDPEDNLHAGIRYTKKMLKRYSGDIELALAAYNAGMGMVQTYGGVPPFQETRQYIKRVKTYYRQYKYGIDAVSSAAVSKSALNGSFQTWRLPLTSSH